MSKRYYEISYTPSENDPPWLSGAGNIYKISGLLVQGEDENYVLLSPTGSWESITLNGHEWVKPTVDQWCQFLKMTDDPLVFEHDNTGTAIAVHRKQLFAVSGAIQQKIWARDGFRCMYCGKRMGDVPLTVDHFIPLESNVSPEAGEWHNLVSACRMCNKRKGSKDPETYCSENELDYEGLRLYLSGKAPWPFIAHLQ